MGDMLSDPELRQLRWQEERFMTDCFGIPQILEYLSQMGIRVARVNHEQEFVELAFYGEQGQWRMVIGLQQHGEARKLILLIPHISTISEEKRIACLEALLAVNYRIALGKFGMDLEDGEIRLEEVVPLASQSISFEQFQLVFGSILQVAIIYHTLLARIVTSDISVAAALQACEDEFLATTGEQGITLSQEQPSELNLDEVMAEVNRLLEKPHE